jgi:hypothetical protein
MRRGIVVLFVCAAAAACGKVKDFTDAQPGDGNNGDGNAGCQATSCSMTADGCCPTACNAANDADCPEVCDNGVQEPGETCDPLTDCPTDCPQIGCQLRTLDNAGTCQAACSNGGMQDACSMTSDGCCPSGCTAIDDIDCSAVCDNGALEPGEQCDPLASCPTSCPQQGCQLYQLFDGGTCQAQCVANGNQTSCINDDGCCPSGCNATNDNDCTAVCDNGVKEPGESCDPLSSCPTSCPAQGCQLRTLVNGGTCQAACQNGSMISACANNDQCCPSGCNANNDNDCMPGCGNGVIEPPETCDPLATCPTSCPQQGCQLFNLVKGGTCEAACQAAGTQTSCVNNDGCCPSGCNANNDNDCSPTCGNSVIEAGETCDPPSSCVCNSEPYTCFTTTGKAADCTLRCHVPVTTCGIDGDSCCAADGSGKCDQTNDKECLGTKWSAVHITDIDTSQGCQTVRVYNIDPTGSYEVTTCNPPGSPVGKGNPIIQSVTNAKTGQTYGSNDDCTDKGSQPWIDGWNCKNTKGSLLMSCAPPNSGGFISPDNNPFDVKICPVGTDTGVVPVWVLFNARSTPNAG